MSVLAFRKQETSVDTFSLDDALESLPKQSAGAASQPDEPRLTRPPLDDLIARCDDVADAIIVREKDESAAAQVSIKIPKRATYRSSRSSWPTIRRLSVIGLVAATAAAVIYAVFRVAGGG